MFMADSKPTKMPRKHEKNSGEKTEWWLRFVAFKGLVLR